MAISKLSTTASLKQVMDKFEEISIQDFSSINIIVSSELPSQSKEGTVCIITNTIGSIIASYEEKTLKQNDIFIKLSEQIGKEFCIKNKNKNIYIGFEYITQNNRPLKSYIFKNGEWIKFTGHETYVFSGGNWNNANTFGNISATVTVGGTIGVESNYLKINKINGSGLAGHTTLQFDATQYKKLKIKFTHIYFNAKDSVFTFGITSARNITSYIAKKDYRNTTGSALTITSPTVMELDISSINAKGYVCLQCNMLNSSERMLFHISDIWFE